MDCTGAGGGFEVYKPNLTPSVCCAAGIPPAVLQRVLAYCSYAEVARLRAVSRAWREACGRALNAAFFRLKAQAEELALSARSQLHLGPAGAERFVRLVTLRSELQLLHAVVARHVARGQCAFCGGRVLDLAAAALPAGGGRLDLATLFFYASLYLDHFERRLEPALAAHDLYGPKVLELLCCSARAGCHVALAYDGAAARVCGVFRVEERGTSAPPARRSCAEVLRYLRGEIRWTNLTAARDAARAGRGADVLRDCSVDACSAGVLRLLGHAASPALLERLFRRQGVRSRGGEGEGVTVAVDLLCPPGALPSLLRREVDAFDAARARDARAEAPERDCARARAHAPPPAPHPPYEFAMLLRARYYQENPRGSGPLMQTELSLYQAPGVTTLVPGVTKPLDAAPHHSPTPTPSSADGALQALSTSGGSSRAIDC